MSEFSVQPARALLHQQRISNRAIARRAGCSAEFVGRVLLGRARPPVALQDFLVALLGRPREELFTAEALEVGDHFPGDQTLAKVDLTGTAS